MCYDRLLFTSGTKEVDRMCDAGKSKHARNMLNVQTDKKGLISENN